MVMLSLPLLCVAQRRNQAECMAIGHAAIIRLHFILQGRMIKISQVSRLCQLGRWLFFNVTMQRLLQGLQQKNKLG